MDEHARITRRLRFGESANAYDAVRPGYPASLVQILVARAGLATTAQVLEIGCGTGQLTRDLAPTGCALVALEPSVELAQLARRNLSRFPKVQVWEEPFERFDAPCSSFDLVAAATSFHWVDPQVRCTKAHRALRYGGFLAILTHRHPRPWSGFFERVQEVYRAIAPELADSGTPSESEQLSSKLTREIRASGLFADVEIVSKTWEQRFDRDRYLTLLGTFSPHRQLPENRRARLFAAIANLIDRECGGFVDQPYSTTLCLARKAQ